jgi:hypothetical protein
MASRLLAHASMHQIRKHRRTNPQDCDQALLGDVRRFPLPDLIEFLVHMRARGKLQVRNLHSRATIALWDGLIIGASSSKICPVDPDFLAPYFLVDRSAIDPEKCRSALRDSVEAVLIEMLAMTEGRFVFSCFRLFEEVPHAIEEIAIDARFAVFDALRQMDEAEAKSIEVNILCESVACAQISDQSAS